MPSPLKSIPFAVAVLTLLTLGGVISQERPVWTYKCETNSVCEKVLLAEGEEPRSLEVCKILCDANAMVWPRPRGSITFNQTLTKIDAQRVTVVASGPNARPMPLLQKAGERFRQQLVTLAKGHEECSGRAALTVEVTIRDTTAVRPELDTDESYTLTVATADAALLKATVNAETFFGARHALETLSQLSLADSISGNVLILDDVIISDSPRYPYRGLNLDTARNYIPMSALKRTIEAMAVNKMNSFHWHITDSHSWPFVSDSYPQLARFGAYSPTKVFTPADVRELVAFGRERGVRVMPELDAPAHVGEGFQFAQPGALVCFKSQPWQDYCVEPPCGQFNPMHDQVYEILSGVYGDMLRLFDTDIFHMGGDEVNLNCWNTSEPVTLAMDAQGIPRTKEGFMQIWDIFQTKAYDKLIEANGGKKLPAILWTNGMTELGSADKYLDKDKYIIEIWTLGNDPLIAELVNKGFRVIFSNYDALYLDCGFGGWVTGGNNWCSPYIGWDRIYDNNPIALLTALGVDANLAQSLTLGAEASLWTEQVDESAVDSRIWPRLAALAERLWTDPQEGWQTADTRMLNHRQRLQALGVQADSLQPQWCVQNQGYCPI